MNIRIKQILKSLCLNLFAFLPFTLTVLTLCVPCVKRSISSYQKYLGKKYIKEFHCPLVSNHKIDLFERKVFQHEETKIGLHSKVQC